MSLISRLFNTKNVDCPRCLGKGHVDSDDIKRLNKELHWIPGPCAYCNEQGLVSASLLSKVPADFAYLTIDISAEERKRIINKDNGAVERGNYFETQTNNFISEVKYLHLSGKLNTTDILNFYLLNLPEDEKQGKYKEELEEYINKIISYKNKTT